MAKTAALFVDLNNIFYCVSKKFSGKKVDYKSYIAEASNIAEIRRAFAYGFQVEDEAMSFITCLRKLGFDTKYKKPRIIGHGDDESKKYKRMDWNVGIAMDVVRTIDKVDAIIIGSSDPELVPLIQWINGTGIQSIIYSSMISKELKDIADRYIEITEACLEVTDDMSS